MSRFDHPLPPSNPPLQHETWRRKAERYGVSTRTLDRWAERGIIEKPTIVRGRKYGRANEEPRPDAA
jgi:predicted site-specific integrase-resolvase